MVCPCCCFFVLKYDQSTIMLSPVISASCGKPRILSIEEAMSASLHGFEKKIVQFLISISCCVGQTD